MTAEHRHSAGQGPVMLDVGDDVGALVLHASAEMAGAEIEISPVGADGSRSHVAVHRREVAGHVRYAAVYPSLKAGQYRLWRPDGTPTDPIVIAGGRVTEVEWKHP
jgi:hypothetical protein